MAWKILPETLPPERRLRLSLAGQVSRYGMIVREKTFLTHAIMGGCSTFCMFAYLSGCSPVFEIGFGLNPSQFALIFGLCAVALIACSQLNARLLPRVGLSNMLTRIARISCAGTIVLVVVAFSGVQLLWAIVAPLVVVIGCQGFANANSTAGALSRHAGHAGSAAALMGTFQFSLGAASGLCLDVAHNSMAAGTPLQIYACNGQANQAFAFTSAGELRVFNNTQCVQPQSGSGTAGMAAVIAACDGQAHQPRICHRAQFHRVLDRRRQGRG